jgi:hypothetical protein
MLEAAQIEERDAIGEVGVPGVAAKSAPVPSSIRVTSRVAESDRDTPRTHSTYAVTDSRRGRAERFSRRRRVILTGSSTGTSRSRSCRCRASRA